MRILIHDFAGHPFQVQLSRCLAARGHFVTHAFADGLPGPKGKLSAAGGDSERLVIRAVRLSSQFRKYSAHRRFLSQRQYSTDLKIVLRETEPDVVLSSNTPIDIQAELLWDCRKRRVGFVHWIQDLYSRALRFFVQRRFPALAVPVEAIFGFLERAVIAGSDHSVVIAPEFREVLCQWNIPPANVTVIENWAALEEMPQKPRDNEWSRAQKLGSRPVLLYSGTLGMKHRPDLIYLLARELQQECSMIVVTDGIGREYLERMPPLANLRMLPFQPYERLPEVLASADVLVATLEAKAGQFAVPSKILTYLCAGRSIFLVGPRENLSASIVERSGAGVVANPNDPAACVEAARKLVADAGMRDRFGSSARSYAERTFDIGRIADSFEKLLIAACGSRARRTAVVSPVSA
jgi:colanic acid biosynthesis glycosyl transferase WcaI